MKKYYNEQIQETYYQERLDNGLTIVYIPRNDFHKTYGILTVNFGSLDTDYMKDGKQYKVIDGAAHFLEHKMFEINQEDYTDLFAKYGANTNAFTSLTNTSYLFETSKNETECTLLLLEMVESFDVTNESIEREKDIIIEELHSFDDDYAYQCYFHNIVNLYENHPIKKDVAGSEESVRSTNLQNLKEIYEAFYHPCNMVLVLSGKMDVEIMNKAIIQHQSKYFKPYTTQKLNLIHEKESVHVKEEIIHEDIFIDKCNLGIKVNDIILDPKLYIQREIGMNILLDIYFSKSSKYYTEFIQKGIVNDSFGYNYNQGKDFAYIQLEIESEDVDEFENYFCHFIKHIQEYSISDQEFDLQKRKNIGYLISLYNSLEGRANTYSRYYFDHFNAFDLFKIAKEITKEDVLSYRKYFNLEYLSVCKVKK